MTNETTRTSLLDRVRQAVYESLLVLCGGGNWPVEDLYQLSQSNVSVSNNRLDLTSSSFWDVQVRVAPALYHRYKQISNTLYITSDLGLTRTIHSAQELGQLLCLQIEPYLIHCDVRCNRSGILCIVTPERSQALRVNRVPCPHCTQWCKGSKGLWWHVQQQHSLEHSEATIASRNNDDSLALVVYQEEPQLQILPVQDTTRKRQPIVQEDPFENAKRGDLAALQKCLQTDDLDPTTAADHRGASLLHWAAGGGHLEIVKYLIQTCSCDPEWKQQGRRAFAGRTALHWACRNGHLKVVKYLVETCQVDVEATTADGTTAFCWASWQAHRHVMEYLVHRQCRVDITNVYQCNAALWAAQGEADQATMEWLELIGCPIDHVNSNGHGILHKAAQRGRRDVCEWFFGKIVTMKDTTTIKLALIGPDTEHHTPSDLAGMEDHEELACWIALQEIQVVQKASQSPNFVSPSWLVSSSSSVVFADNVWEAYGGVRRMQAGLLCFARGTSQNKDGTLVSSSNPHCVIDVPRS